VIQSIEQVAVAPASSTWRYVTPFAAFMILLVAAGHVPLSPAWELPLRCVVMAVVCAICWPPEVSLRLRTPLLTVAVGVAVFLIWIAPDRLIPGYRTTSLFSNAVVGHLRSSIPSSALLSPWVLFWRTARAVVIVPVIEELFWRGWLMRWIIDREFNRVPLGTYAAGAFWITAVLFASEHGPFWDVGLIAGIAYNGWMVRTRSLGDCMLAHAITNGLLSWYVIATAQWQYWQ
jgi:hypothetical protein